MPVTDWHANYALPTAVYNQSEDFATVFDLMITSGKPLLERDIWNGGQERKLNSNDIICKKCEAVYALMLRDFGVESAAVIRAAWFLGKQLPAQ